jgi:serine/threonine protein kinase
MQSRLLSEYQLEKPFKIIHRQDHIFFTDFSSAGNFNVGHTTSTASPTRSTAMYAAPEALLPLCSADSRFGTALDVFGLGCVFCDMLTVETGGTVHEFCKFLSKGDIPASRGGLRHSKNLSRFGPFFQGKGGFYKDCISKMLAYDRKARPTAEAVHEYSLQTHRPLPR